MNLQTFLDGLVAVCGQDIAWIVAFTVAGGILLALYIPIAALGKWALHKWLPPKEE